MDEKFLLDANTFITPFQNYYSFDLAPGFWKQLKTKLKLNSVYLLDVAKNEIEKTVHFHHHQKQYNTLK